MPQRMPAAGQRHGIVTPQLHGQPRQASTLGDFLGTVIHPAIELAPEVAPCRHAIGRGEFRVTLDGPVEQRQRLGDGFTGAVVQLRRAAQVVVVGAQVGRGLALGPFDFGALQLRRDGTHHAFSHLVLQFEQVVELAFETFGPQVLAGTGFDQLAGNAHALAGLAHAAFEHVAHAKGLADPLHIDTLALEGKAGVAGDHEQPADARQRGDDVLDHAIGEIVLVRVTAQVLERQHGNRGFFREGRR
ncbi:hypothetical protein D3C80_1254860 [compost metagenome]